MSEGIAATARIRLASPEDALGIGRVQSGCWRSTYAGLIPDHVLVRMTPERQAAMWRRCLVRHSLGTIYVAEAEDRQIIGFGSCGREQTGRMGFDGEVYTLYVDEAAQGQGLGRRLVGVMFRRLQRDGLRSAAIWVLQGNPARFFYETIGGTRIGTRQSRQWGVAVHELAYGWRSLNIG